MTIQQQNILWGCWDWTSDCQPCDSLDADKDGDELLDGVELQVVVDQAHPVAMVRGACLGTRVTFYIFDASLSITLKVKNTSIDDGVAVLQLVLHSLEKKHLTL